MAEVSFGEWLKRRRAAEGWTQEQLAQKIHCSTSALRKFESEERRPSAGVVDQLAEIFSIPAGERKSFLHYARGDWRAFGNGSSEKPPWCESDVDQPSSLPALITSFIGREKEQAEIIDFLKENRLVTLAGVGGIGKTRLAIQVGYELQHDYPDGVWFVALDSLFDPLLVPQTVAAAFSIREGAGRPVIETLKNVLRRKTLLLILDNCEHMVEACAQLVTTLLAYCPNLKILTTSREILHVEGEATYSLPSLSTPEENISPEHLTEYESIRLFVERAALAQSKFQLTEENAQAMLDICRRLDGIPLAIELTAARVNILKVEEIAKQLNKSFSILAGERRTGLSRHQTLRASLDWSWSLLTKQEQAFLCQLSVFAGGWTLEAAEAVCEGDALHLTHTLAQKSLIGARQEGEHGTRYHFHEIVRQYAHQKLFEARSVETIRHRHLAYFVRLVEEAEPELYRSNQVFWMNKLDNELDNLRVALEWALATDVESGLRIASIPWRFWERHDYFLELGDWLGRLLEHRTASDVLYIQSLAVHSHCYFRQGNFAEAIRIASDSLRMARALSDRQLEAFTLSILGVSTLFQGKMREGNSLLEQSLATYRSLGNKIGQANTLEWLAVNNSPERAMLSAKECLAIHRELGNLSGVAVCLNLLSLLTIRRGDFSSTNLWLEEALSISRRIGHQTTECYALTFLGDAAFWQGDYEQASSYYREAILLAERIGDGYQIVWIEIRMAYTVFRQGDIQQARKMFIKSIRDTQKAALRIALVFTVEGLAGLLANQQQPEHAIRLLAWADAARKKIGNPRPLVEQAEVDKNITVCLAKMGEAAFSDAYEEGEKMSLEEAVEYAVEET